MWEVRLNVETMFVYYVIMAMKTRPKKKEQRGETGHKKQWSRKTKAAM